MNQTRASAALRIRFRGEVENRGDADDLLDKPGDVVLVNRGRPRSLVFSCPDGCGSALTINLDQRSGPAWRLYRSHRGLTLYPSVWRDSGCGAHFIVSQDRLLWCDRWLPDATVLASDSDLERRLLSILDTEPRTAEMIAQQMAEDPWEVERAADRLVATGRASSTDKGLYSRREAGAVEELPQPLPRQRGIRALVGMIRRLLG